MNFTEFGRYQLIERIGMGGMAEVFLARSFGAEGLEKFLVIKKILPSLAKSSQFVSMFIEEAKISVSLNHPNIVQVYEFGKVGTDYFLVMEYVDGLDLSRLASYVSERGRRLSLGHGVFVVQELAKGLDYAHRRRDHTGRSLEIVHRDISPHNILISFDGAVKVVDFGISRMRDTVEEEGLIQGKYRYMSPEQAQGQRVHQASDIYSLGVVLFELITGRCLVPQEDDVSALREAVIRADIPDPRQFNPQIGEELVRVTRCSLARRPEDRYPTARDLQMELMRVLHDMDDVHDATTLGGFVQETVPDTKRLLAVVRTQLAHAKAGMFTMVERLSVEMRSEAHLTPGPGATTTRANLEGSIPPLETIRILARETRNVVMVKGVLFGLDRPDLLPTYLPMLENLAFKYGALPYKLEARDLTFVLGLPTSDESDPEQSLRLAMDLREATQGFGRSHGVEASLGLGVFRSRVEVEQAGRSRRVVPRVSQDTLQEMSHLVQGAQAGEILVNNEIFLLTRHAFRFGDPGGTRGLTSRPLLAALERSERLALAIKEHSVLVGREAELATLRDLYREMMASGESRSVAVVGEMGIGKSSLGEEFVRRLDQDQCITLRCACFVHTSDLPYSAVADMILDHLGDKADLPRRIRKLMAGLFRGEGEEEVQYITHSFAYLLGIKAPGSLVEPLDPETRCNRINLSLKRFLDRLSRSRPLVLFIEDVHWADTTSLRLLHEMVSSRYDRPIYTLMTMRPVDWLTPLLGTERLTQVHLTDLGEQERLDVVARLFDPNREVKEVASWVVERAGGNPFFLMEMVRTLEDRGVAMRTDKGLVLVRSLEEVADSAALPESVEGVVTARIDSLPSRERMILQLAAVVGREVTEPLLSELSGCAVLDELSQLVERRLLVAQRTEGGLVYTFPNALIEEAAYSRLPKEDRVRIHLELAEMLKGRVGMEVGISEAALARHYLTGQRPEEAAAYFFRAGQKAMRGCSNHEARRLLSRAIELSPLPQLVIQALEARATVESRLGMAREQVEDIRAMQMRAQEAGLVEAEARALNLLAEAHLELVKPAVLKRLLAEALSFAKGKGLKLHEGVALRLAGLFYRDSGQYEKALTVFKRALEIFESLGDRQEIAFTRHQIGIVYRRMGDFRQAIQYNLSVFGLGGDKAFEGRAANALGVAYACLAEYDQALVYFKQALRYNQEFGDRQGIGMRLGNIGQLYQELGDYPSAIKYLTRAIEAYESLGQVPMQADSLINLGNVYGAMKIWSEALGCLNRGLEIAETYKKPHYEILGRNSLALYYLQRGSRSEVDLAVEQASRALDLARAAPNVSGQIVALVRLASAHMALGEVEAALAHAEGAVSLLASQEHIEGAEEEVYLVYSEVLEALGRRAEARGAIERAHAIVVDKGARLQDSALRKIFLYTERNRVIISRAAMGDEKIDV